MKKEASGRLDSADATSPTATDAEDEDMEDQPSSQVDVSQVVSEPHDGKYRDVTFVRRGIC